MRDHGRGHQCRVEQPQTHIGLSAKSHQVGCSPAHSDTPETTSGVPEEHPSFCSKAKPLNAKAADGRYHHGYSFKPVLHRRARETPSPGPRPPSALLLRVGRRHLRCAHPGGHCRFSSGIRPARWKLRLRHARGGTETGGNAQAWSARLGMGSDSPQNFRGDGQLAAFEVCTELTQMVEIGDFFPKLVTEQEKARE